MGTIKIIRKNIRKSKKALDERCFFLDAKQRLDSFFPSLVLSLYKHLHCNTSKGFAVRFNVNHFYLCSRIFSRKTHSKSNAASCNSLKNKRHCLYPWLLLSSFTEHLVKLHFIDFFFFFFCSLHFSSAIRFLLFHMKIHFINVNFYYGEFFPFSKYEKKQSICERVKQKKVYAVFSCIILVFKR